MVKLWNDWNRPLLCVPDKDDGKQKDKNHETIPSRFFPEQKTKKSFVLSHLCPVHEQRFDFEMPIRCLLQEQSDDCVSYRNWK